MPTGKRIFLQRELPDKKLIESFSKLPSATIDDCMSRNAGMNARIKLMSKPNKIMCGPALTVKARSGDNLAVQAALNYAKSGDIIVVSTDGEYYSRAIVGEVMLTYAKYQDQLGGIVIDGPIRDIDSLKNFDMPIYATGTTPEGPYTEGPGEVNVPVTVGDRSINPGDIIVGDEDGVVVIPREDAEDLLPKAQAYDQKDAARVHQNQTSGEDRSFVEQALKNKGFEIIDDIYSNRR